MSRLSRLFNWGQPKQADSSEQSPSKAKPASWSFFSLWKKKQPDYSKLPNITAELEKINRTTFWRQSSLSARIRDVWDKNKIGDGENLQNDELRKLFSLSKELKEKEDCMINSWNSSFLANIASASPTFKIKEIQKWVLEKRTSNQELSEEQKEEFANDLLDYLDFKENPVAKSNIKKELIDGIKCLNTSNIRGIIIYFRFDGIEKNNIYSLIEKEIKSNVLEKLKNCDEESKKKIKELNFSQIQVLWKRIENISPDNISELNVESTIKDVIVNDLYQASLSKYPDQTYLERLKKLNIENLNLLYENVFFGSKSFKETLEELEKLQESVAVLARAQSVHGKLGDTSQVSLVEVPNYTGALVDKVSAGTAEESASISVIPNEGTVDQSLVSDSVSTNETAPILPIRVIANGDDFDRNRCFLNAPFQLLMRLPQLRCCLKNLLKNYFGVIETFSVGQGIDFKNLEYAYQGLLEAIRNYEAGKNEINLTPLRGLFIGREGKEQGQFGEAEEVLSKIFAPFMQIPILTDALPQLVKTTYLEATEASGLLEKRDANNAVYPIQKEGDRKFYSENKSSLIFQCESGKSAQSFFQPVEYVGPDQSAMGGRFWDQSKGPVSCKGISGEVSIENSPKQLIFNLTKADGRPKIDFNIIVPRADRKLLEYKLVGAVLHLNNHYVSIIQDKEGSYQYVDDLQKSLREANEQDFQSMQNNATLVAYELVEL